MAKDVLNRAITLHDTCEHEVPHSQPAADAPANPGPAPGSGAGLPESLDGAVRGRGDQPPPHM